MLKYEFLVKINTYPRTYSLTRLVELSAKVLVDRGEVTTLHLPEAFGSPRHLDGI